jgi:hypothetical protein
VGGLDGSVEGGVSGLLVSVLLFFFEVGGNGKGGRDVEEEGEEK